MSPRLKPILLADGINKARTPFQAREVFRDFFDGGWMYEGFMGANVICL